MPSCSFPLNHNETDTANEITAASSSRSLARVAATDESSTCCTLYTSCPETVWEEDRATVQFLSSFCSDFVQ